MVAMVGVTSLLTRVKDSTWTRLRYRSDVTLYATQPRTLDSPHLDAQKCRVNEEKLTGKKNRIVFHSFTTICYTASYDVQCTTSNVQCTTYAVHCRTIYTVQCTVYSVQCTVYRVFVHQIRNIEHTPRLAK